MRRLGGTAARAAVLLVVNGLALWVLAAVIPGIDVPSFEGAVLSAAVIALLNALLWPTVTRIALPLTLLAFALAAVVVSAGTVEIAIELVDGTDPTFAASLLTGLGLAAVMAVVAPLLDFDGDAYHLRTVRRRVRESHDDNLTDVPGVIFFEIDGLGEAILREAVRDGHVPTIARWLEEGTHRLVGWECDLSSQTGASQAGLLHGSNDDMPAFRWYEKESRRMMVSNHPRDAAEIERRQSNGPGLLARNGTSRGNLLSGGAPRCLATLSAIRDRGRSNPRDFYAYFSDPYGFPRTVALCLHDIALERVAARRQRRSGVPHVHRGGSYPLARCAITVAMRDLNTATLMADIVEGVPASYSTFVGYDEVAHHSGIREPDAFAVLRRLDKQLRRLEFAAQQAPRPYHLVVLSDHGQTQGAPFRQRFGAGLEDVVREAAAGAIQAPRPVDEAWGDLGAVLTEAREDRSLGGRIVRRVTRGRMRESVVALGPNEEALAQQEAVERSDADLVVLASGNLGLVYLTDHPGRVTLEHVEREHPKLVPALSRHPGIGFVMLRSDAHGPVVIGGGGRRYLDRDEVEGDDPLAPFGPNAADHLRRHDGFRHCPDILVNAFYDPATGETAPFEDFMGSHGGLGGIQSHPFAVAPADWPAPAKPIVGAEAMHAQLRTWLAKSGPDVPPGSDPQ
jgi:uncharacterized membrane protein YvlD (DUF360 family)